MPVSEISRLEIAKQHYQYGLEFLEQRDWNASIRKFREVIGLVPDKADAHFPMGNAFRSAGDLDGSVAEFSCVMSTGSERTSLPHGHTAHRCYTRKTNDLDRAMAEYKAAVELDPCPGYLHHRIATIFITGRIRGGYIRVACGWADPQLAMADSDLGSLLVKSGMPA